MSKIDISWNDYRVGALMDAALRYHLHSENRSVPEYIKGCIHNFDAESIGLIMESCQEVLFEKELSSNFRNAVEELLSIASYELEHHAEKKVPLDFKNGDFVVFFSNVVCDAIVYMAHDSLYANIEEAAECVRICIKKVIIPDICFACNILSGIEGENASLDNLRNVMLEYVSEQSNNPHFDDDDVIELLQLSVREYNCLKRGSIATVGDVKKAYKKDKFMSLPHINGIVANKIVRHMEKYAGILLQ